MAIVLIYSRHLSTSCAPSILVFILKNAAKLCCWVSRPINAKQNKSCSMQAVPTKVADLSLPIQGCCSAATLDPSTTQNLRLGCPKTRSVLFGILAHPDRHMLCLGNRSCAACIVLSSQECMHSGPVKLRVWVGQASFLL